VTVNNYFAVTVNEMMYGGKGAKNDCEMTQSNAKTTTS